MVVLSKVNRPQPRGNSVVHRRRRASRRVEPVRMGERWRPRTARAIVVTNDRVHDVRVLPEAARDVASHQRQCGAPWCNVDTRSSHPVWP